MLTREYTIKTKAGETLTATVKVRKRQDGWLGSVLDHKSGKTVIAATKTVKDAQSAMFQVEFALRHWCQKQKAHIVTFDKEVTVTDD